MGFLGWGAATLVVFGVLTAGCVDPRALEIASEPESLSVVQCREPCLRLIDGKTSQWWEPDAAVDPLDPLHVVVAASSLGRDAVGRVTWWDYTHVSRDGGLTWRSSRFPGGVDAGPTHPLAAYGMLGDPVVAFLPDGTLLHATLAGLLEWPTFPADAHAFARTGMDLVVARSSDGGLTYPAEDIRFVATGQGLWASAYAGSPVNEGVEDYLLFDWHDKPWFDVGPKGDVLLAWSEFMNRNPPRGEIDGRTDLLVSYSPNGGRSWTQPAVVLRGGSSGFAAPAILKDGTWVVAFRDADTKVLSVAVSMDQAATWKVRRLAQDASFLGLALEVQPVPEAQRLLLLYAREADAGTGFLVPTLVWSDDRGATWKGPLDLDTPEASGQVLPALDVGPDGRAWATYLHPYVAGEERRVDANAVLIGDGVVSEPFVLDSGIHRTVGHYWGLAAFPDGAFAAWPGHGGDTSILMGSRLVANTSPYPDADVG